MDGSPTSASHDTPDGEVRGPTTGEEVELPPLAETDPPEPAPDFRIQLVRGDERRPKWAPRATVYIFAGIIGLYAARGIVASLRGIIITIVLSLFVSFAMEPAVNWLNDRGWRRGSATGLVLVGVLFGAGLFIYVMVDLLVGEVSNLVENAPDYIDQATQWVNDTFDTEIETGDLDEQFADYQDELQDLATNLGGRVFTLTTAVIGVIFQLFTIGLFTFYLVADGPRMRRSVLSTIREDRQRLVLAIWELAIQKTGGYIYSRILLATAAGILSWIAFTIIGIPSPLANALWLGLVSQFIPVIGTYLAGALPVVLALLSDPVDAIWVLGFIVVYQQIENYLVSPRITAHTMAIHPAIAFGSVLVGGSILGGVGALLALPAAAIIQAFVSTYLARHQVVASDLTFVQAAAQPRVRSPMMSQFRQSMDSMMESVRRGQRRDEKRQDQSDKDDAANGEDDGS